jgi:hypothetical protein
MSSRAGVPDDICPFIRELSNLIIFMKLKRSATAQKPFLAYYGARFLLWELSTLFLNINW